jgi:hypothetical protein
VDSNGRTIFVADAYRSDGQRFIVRADEKLSAFVELEAAIHAAWQAAHALISEAMKATNLRTASET